MSAIDDHDLIEEVMNGDEIDWEESLEPGVQNLIDARTLKWIFVGGKGGVGKTTTSCSLAATLAKHRKSVLIISTDPAHNLSDAFSQKIGKKPTKLNGWDNLFAMEIDPTVDVDAGDALDDSSKNLISELASSIPGIDEAMSFAEIMKSVQNMEYETIVFDTAPTGHTLRLLSFPSVLEKGLSKIMAIKSKFSGIFQQMQTVMDNQGTSEEQVYNKLEQAKAVIEQVNQQFQDPEITTFTCVCIPEFLSLFETERLVQELSKYGIDSCNVVVNQVLLPEKDSSCKKCNARVRMQGKYLRQIFDLYEDFHITVVPLLDEEVRGKEGLESFGKLLLSPPDTDALLALQDSV